MGNILLKRYMSRNMVNLFNADNSSAVYCEVNNFVRSNTVLNRLENLNSDFDAAADRNNRIHIIYQDINKNIVYVSHNNSDWNKYELLKARSSTSVSADNFRIFKNDKYLGILYTIVHNGERMLCSQFIGENSVPEAIGAVSKEFSEYILVSDTMGNIYVIYSENSADGFGYRHFKWSKKEWSEFKSLNIRSGVIAMSAFIDERNMLHLCYKTAEGLFYKSGEISFDDFLWQDEKLLTRQHTNIALSPIINKVDDTLVISWGMFDRIIAVLSADNGKTWSKLREIGIARGGDIQKIRVAMPNSSVSSEFYGYILNNRFNVPMLEKYIDTETERENEFNNSFIGVPHNEGYDAERFANNYPFDLSDSEINTQNYVSSQEIQAPQNSKFNNTDFWELNRNRANKLSEKQIERIKSRIAEEMKAYNINSVSSSAQTFNFDTDTKIVSVRGALPVIQKPEAQTELPAENSEIIKENTRAVSSGTEKSPDNFNSTKNDFIKLCDELSRLNSSLEQILESRTESSKELPVKKYSYRIKQKRRKANLCKTHIKKI